MWLMIGLEIEYFLFIILELMIFKWYEIKNFWFFRGFRVCKEIFKKYNKK